MLQRREPYTITESGLVWLLHTDTSERVLQFPSIRIDDPKKERVRQAWTALSEIKDPSFSRVEVGREHERMVPYVGFSPHGGPTGRGPLEVRRVVATLQSVGLNPADIQASLIMVSDHGDEQVVCSPISLPRVPSWRPLFERVDDPLGFYSDLNQPRGHEAGKLVRGARSWHTPVRTQRRPFLEEPAF